MGRKETPAEKLVRESFERGDADKDWGTAEDRRRNVERVRNEPDPANDLPPL